MSKDVTRMATDILHSLDLPAKLIQRRQGVFSLPHHSLCVLTSVMYSTHHVWAFFGVVLSFVSSWIFNSFWCLGVFSLTVDCKLESVEIEAFGAFLGPVKYPLTDRGVRIVSGKNLDSMGADSNGAGKSTLVMAPLWALTGRHTSLHFWPTVKVKYGFRRLWELTLLLGLGFCEHLHWVSHEVDCGCRFNRCATWLSAWVNCFRGGASQCQAGTCTGGWNDQWDIFYSGAESWQVSEIVLEILIYIPMINGYILMSFSEKDLCICFAYGISSAPTGDQDWSSYWMERIKLVRKSEWPKTASMNSCNLSHLFCISVWFLFFCDGWGFSSF